MYQVWLQHTVYRSIANTPLIDFLQNLKFNLMHDIHAVTELTVSTCLCVDTALNIKHIENNYNYV